MRLTTSLLRRGKVSWLCCVGAVSSPTSSITLASSMRENLLLHSSYLPLGVSQRTCDLHVSSTFSSAVAGDLKAHLLRDFNSYNNTFSGTIDKHFFWRRSHQAAARGVSHFQPFYFVIVLLSLLLLCVVCFFYQNPKKISYLHLVYFQFIIMSSCLLAINGNKILLSKWVHGGTAK